MSEPASTGGAHQPGDLFRNREHSGPSERLVSPFLRALQQVARKSRPDAIAPESCHGLAGNAFSAVAGKPARRHVDNEIMEVLLEALNQIKSRLGLS